jgi:uncharacterized membrane-anchored protein YhcB (DUF1043 family)
MVVAKSKSDDPKIVGMRIGMVVARVYRETLISGSPQRERLSAERDRIITAFVAKRERIWEHFAVQAKFLPRRNRACGTWHFLSVSIWST